MNAQAAFRYSDWSAGTGRRQSDWVLYLYNRNAAGRVYDPVHYFLAVPFESETWHAKYDGTTWGHLYDLFSYERLEEFNAIEDDEAVKRKAVALAPSRTNEIDNNVFIDILQIVNREKDQRPSLNLHDNLEGADLSLFVDPENGNYNFTEEALALIRESCPDFEPLPLDQIGPQK